MIFRDVIHKDIKDIKQWWKDWDFPIVEDFVLSKNGYIVEDSKGNKICAVWLYLTHNSNCCWFAWPITNKNIEENKKDRALDYLIKSVCQEAIKKNNKIILTTVESKTFSKRLEKLGFRQGDKNVTQYFFGEKN